jgi:putative SOS response-associated peptidase YedK
MCGRSQFLRVPEVAESFGPARVADVTGVVEEAFPGSLVPGLVVHQGERVLSSFTWAFFEDGTGHNARLETAAERPAWRVAMTTARLVLPLARFVEGPAWFRDAGGGPLAVAGLYRLGPRRDRPAAGRRAAMLTRPADGTVTAYHERMPVILPADLVEPWLAGADVPLDRLLAESPPLDVEPLTPPGPPPPEQPSLL